MVGDSGGGCGLARTWVAVGSWRARSNAAMGVSEGAKTPAELKVLSLCSGFEEKEK